MKGHIKQRSKGSWSIVIDVGKDPETGKRKQHWHTIKGTKRDAQRELNEMLVSLEKGLYVKPNKIAVRDCAMPPQRIPLLKLELKIV